MKNWLIGLVVTMAWTSPCVAQVAPELLGGADPDKPMFSESFYKGIEGNWVLVREPVNTGYHCSVNFITPDSTLSFRGPADAGMARKGHGSLWFISKAIPGDKARDRSDHVVIYQPPYAECSGRPCEHAWPEQWGVVADHRRAEIAGGKAGQ